MSDSTKAVITFLAKGVAAYGLWYIAYDLWLLPDGRLDAWLSFHVVETSGMVLSTLGQNVFTDGRLIQLAGTPGLKVVNGCNGLTTIGLFIGFIIAYPGTTVRRLLFIPLGALVIYASNVVRVSTLAIFQRHWLEAFEWVHGLGAPTFFYLVVFGLWVLWVNFGGSTRQPSSSDNSQTQPVMAS